MKKINIVIVITTILMVLPFSSKGQYGFLESNHTFSVNENELKVYQTATFSLGSGSVCPPMVDHVLTINNDTLNLCVSYDRTGSFPTFFCSRTDTIIELISTGQYTLIVNSQIIYYDGQNSVIDTAKVDADTSYNLILDLTDLSEDDPFSVYPNPAHGKLFLDYQDHISVENIEMITIEGKEVEMYLFSPKEMYVSHLKPGMYYLRINLGEKMIYKKVQIE